MVPTPTALLTTLVALWLVGGIIWFARRRSDYQHVRHTISELGEVGAPDARRVAWLLFAPVGLVLLAVGILALRGGTPEPLGEPFGLLALAVGVGYLGAVLFPCDPGSPLAGSSRQQLHNLAGGVEYLGGAAALFMGAQALAAAAPLAVWLQVCAAIVVIVTVALSLQAAFPVRGLVQRVGETVLLSNLVLLAWL